MLWSKACPKCQTGDVVLGRDKYGPYVHCMQCGYMRDLKESLWLVTKPQKRQKPKPQPA